ncbi:MAG: S-layer homology domain-containing protein [Microcystaceae cyanobacterium]
MSLFITSLSLLVGCSGNSALQDRFSPDPSLNSPQTVESPSPSSSPSPQRVSQLPPQFPSSIPLYRNAKMIETKGEISETQGTTYWESDDPINVLKSRYQAEFKENNWEIIQPFNLDTDNEEDKLIASKENLEVNIYFKEIGRNNQFIIEYKPLNTAVNPNSSPSLSPSPSNSPALTNMSFADLNEVPAPLQKYLSDLTNLGELTAYQGTSDQFKPEQPISRREYARWLFNIHNQLYRNQSAKQIRPSSRGSEPVFSDIPASDPDFAVIQGLAEAGVLRSSLTGDTEQTSFRPDAPLLREDLLIWKVPVDLRKALPSATIDNVKETWGFQDTNKIPPLALRALYADFQNGDKANVRRVFGYTTLFNPKKAVTRAEAAAALWYFGFQGDGISAQEVLEIQNSSSVTNNG